MSDNHAIDNAKGWLETIRELACKLGDDGLTEGQREEARQEVEEGPLSVQVRGSWHSPGADAGEPIEYEILLSTGGPALRIWGELGGYSTPDDDPRLQWQDWGTPWTDYALTREEASDVAAYARCFYFGE